MKIEPKLNGLLCPNCGAPLYDSNPKEQLESFPPQTLTICLKCKYTGRRVVDEKQEN